MYPLCRKTKLRKYVKDVYLIFDRDESLFLALVSPGFGYK